MEQDNRLFSEGVLDSQHDCLTFSVVKTFEIATGGELSLEKVNCIKKDLQSGLKASLGHAFLILKDYLEFVSGIVVRPPLKRNKMVSGGLRREYGDLLLLRMGNGTILLGTHVVVVHNDTVYDFKPGEINPIEEGIKICKKKLFVIFKMMNNCQ